MSVITLTKEESLDNNCVVQISPTATSDRRSPLDFKAKLLRHLISKRSEGGFTLIELLVVIIIIGILAAISLPSFLRQVNKAKEVEAQIYISHINQAQQIYYLENGSFTTNPNYLGISVKLQTPNYNYSFQKIPPNPTLTDGVAVIAQPVKSGMKSYVGSNYIGDNTGEIVFVICVSEDMFAPGYGNGIIMVGAGGSCPKGYVQLGKPRGPQGNR